MNDIIPGTGDERAYYLSVNCIQTYLDVRRRPCRVVAELVVGEKAFNEKLLPIIENEPWRLFGLVETLAPECAAKYEWRNPADEIKIIFKSAKETGFYKLPAPQN